MCLSEEVENLKKYPSPCWRCGKEHLFVYEPLERVFCPECKQLEDAEREERKKEYVRLKMDMMLERALRIMERSTKVCMDSMREPFKVLSEKFRNGEEEYKSAEEIVTALVLMDNGYDYTANMRIGHYMVDFYIPELKAILEVDGHEHSYKTVYDSKRDLEVRRELPKDWEIVRIKTELIAINPQKIPDAVKEMREEKQKLRKKNGGIIPETFSERERDFYKRFQARKKLNSQ